MKRLQAAVALLLIGLVSAGCPGLRPDLVVTSLTTNGTPTVNADNSAEVPILVVVRNNGTASAGIFKVSVQYTVNSQTFVVAFTVAGQTDIWYPWTDAALAPGEQVMFAGTLTFHPSLHNVTVSLEAVADSTDGDEFIPATGRVLESDETNNVSSPVEVDLP